MTNILVGIADIGYGPTMTTLPILRAMRRRRRDLRVAGIGGSLVQEQCEASRLFDAFYPCDLSLSQMQRYVPLFRQADIVVSNSSISVVEMASQVGRPAVFVDILMFLHRQVPPALNSCVCYIVQDFFGVAERLRELGANVPNQYVVGPLIAPRQEPSGARPAREGWLVSLGGGTYGHHFSVPQQRTAARLLGGILLEVANAAHEAGCRLTVCGGSEIGQSLRALGVNVTVMPHERHLRELDNAALVLLLPGLTGMNECRSLGRVPVLMPPFNYSQLVQQALAVEHWSSPAICWSDLCDGWPAIAEDLAEPEGNRLLLAHLEYLDVDSIRARMRDLMPGISVSAADGSPQSASGADDAAAAVLSVSGRCS